MFKKIGNASALLAGVAFAACGGGSNGGKAGGTGSVDLALQIPDGQSVSTIDLNINCPDSNVDQAHTLNVVNGVAVASFGGLAPGVCTAAMTSTTPAGYLCEGSSQFTIVAGEKVDAVVTLVCQGTNASPNGSATITPEFSTEACTEDRIQKVFAIPANLLTGESTLVEVEINQAAVVGSPKPYVWAVRNDASNTGTGSLAEGTCSANSASCQTFTCTGLGASPGVDPRTSLPASGVWVTVTFQDDDCYDTEEVWVQCIQASVCGDGTVEGTEACDDGNTTSEDGCSATCAVESCGDNVVQAGLGEQCDGIVGVGPNQGCDSSCQLTDLPVCGDGSKNQAIEECDGTDGLQAGQQCSANCTIVPVCGNGIVEGTEACDEVSATCGQPGTPEACTAIEAPSQCLTCINALPDIGDFNTGVCQPDAQCAAALECLIENSSCWTSPVPAGCFCGSTQADIDACENPTFVPTGACAAELRAGAGGAANADVLSRYFDFNFASGNATIIFDAAFNGCNAECF